MVLTPLAPWGERGTLTGRYRRRASPMGGGARSRPAGTSDVAGAGPARLRDPAPTASASAAPATAFNSPLSATAIDELGDVATPNGGPAGAGPALSARYGCPTRPRSRKDLGSDRPAPAPPIWASTSMALAEALAGAARREGSGRRCSSKTAPSRSSFCRRQTPSTTRPILESIYLKAGDGRIVPIVDHRDTDRKGRRPRI